MYLFIKIERSFENFSISATFCEIREQFKQFRNPNSQNFLACGELKVIWKSQKVFDLSEFFACLKMAQVFDLSMNSNI